MSLFFGGCCGGTGVRDTTRDTDANGSTEMTRYNLVPAWIEAMRPELDICVCNPLTNKFTTYEIAIQTSQPAFNLKRSRTRRRYNDFCWLRKELKSHNPMGTAPPVLPPKKQSSERFEPQFLVRRMKDLEEWLYRIVSTSLYESDTVVHLFLQSSLSCDQIAKYMKGELPEQEVENGYKDCQVVTMDTHSVFKTAESTLEKTDSIKANDEQREAIGDDGGHPASLSESVENDNDSSYESQTSSRGSPDDFAAEGYPAVTEVYCAQKALQNQSVRNRETNGETSPQRRDHVTWEDGGVSWDDDQCCEGNSIAEGAVGGTESLVNSEEAIDSGVEKSLGDSSEKNTKKKSKSGSHKVHGGVIFSINS